MATRESDRARNLIIRRGELLTSPTPYVGGGTPKTHPITVNDGRLNLRPHLTRLVQELRSLPAEEWIRGKTVFSALVRREYIAKSYHPAEILRRLGMSVVGSRVFPHSDGNPGVELFVSAQLRNVESFAVSTQSELPENSPAGELVQRIERVFRPDVGRKVLRGIWNADRRIVVALFDSDTQFEYGQSTVASAARLQELGLDIVVGSERQEGGLVFLLAHGDHAAAQRAASHAFVRAL